MKYDRMWERLIEYLNGWSAAREVPGGIEVVFDHPSGESRTVEIVISPADYDDYLSTIFGDDNPAIAGIRPELMSMSREQRYLVYEVYDWVPSTTPSLPPDPFDDIEVVEAGEWVVTDREGNVTSRFSE